MESLDLSLTLDREHLQKLLISSLTRLCHSKVSFKSTLAIEGLLGLTVDNTTVQLISIKEVLHNGIVSRDSSNDLSGTHLKHSAVSRSRRKSKVTRKAVVSLENDCGSNLNDDWNMNDLADDEEEEEDGKDTKPSDGPLNLVKSENVDWSSNTPEESDHPKSSSTAQMTTDQMDSKLNVSHQMFIPNTAQQELSLNSSHSWTLPLSNIRKYGSYGYVINQGNDVMFSCNQCPKTFRNRVSLWRHGVKHKMSQDPSSSKVIPSGLWSSMVSAGDNNITLNEHRMTSQPAEVVNDPEPFQDNCFGSIVRSHLMDKLNNHTIQGRKLKRKKEVKNDKQSTDLCVPSSVPSVKSGIMMKQFKTAKKDLRTSQTVSPDSLSCITDEQMEPGSNLKDPDDGISEAQNACVGEETEVTRSALREGRETLPVSSGSGLVLPSCVPTEQTNMRLISGYGYVVNTADGKLYKCLKCLKSFKNRVSLWKHQSKHQ